MKVVRLELGYANYLLLTLLVQVGILKREALDSLALLRWRLVVIAHEPAAFVFDDRVMTIVVKIAYESVVAEYQRGYVFDKVFALAIGDFVLVVEQTRGERRV